MKHYHRIPPIRTRVDLAHEIGQVIHHLQAGELTAANYLIEGLKSRFSSLSPFIQKDLRIFAEAVQFQADYDPWHIITPEIEAAAEQLVVDLGLSPSRKNRSA